MMMKKMYKGNAMVVFTVNEDETVDAVCYINRKETQHFTYTMKQALAVAASYNAIGFKNAIVEEKTSAPKKDAPKKTAEERKTEKYGDLEHRRHFIEVRNRICITAGAYFDTKAKEANKYTPKDKEYKKQRTAFINKWANAVIAQEQQAK